MLDEAGKQKLRDNMTARRIIRSFVLAWISSLDTRIMHDSGEWEENREKIEKDYEKLGNLCIEASRYLTRTVRGSWNKEDEKWLEKYLDAEEEC